jgi:protein TonB
LAADDESHAPGARATPPAAPGEGAAPGASASSAPHEGLRADALREYRLALAIEARRYKRYPPLARERGWEGTVEATVSAGSVAVPLVALERSSGHAVLDEQTLEMLRRAVLSTPLPEGLRGRDFRVVVPVRFSLESDQ